MDVLGHRWQIHAMLAFMALTLIGAQIVQLGVFARTIAMVFRPRVSLERGPLSGSVVTLAGFGILVAVFVSWAEGGFGTLAHEYATALGFTLLGLGVQIVFASFFLALLVMRAAGTDSPEVQLADTHREEASVSA